jgi:hypothetical protein
MCRTVNSRYNHIRFIKDILSLVVFGVISIFKVKNKISYEKRASPEGIISTSTARKPITTSNMLDKMHN